MGFLDVPFSLGCHSFYNMNEIEEDALWFKLWKSRSLEELRLKCAIYGVDMEHWLKTDGYMWIPKDDRS